MRKAFTLIELLIVVAIIAILAAIAVPNFLEAQMRAKVSRAKADMRSLTTGIESYCVDNNCYPPIIAPNSPWRLTGSGNINGNSCFYAGITGISSRFVWITTPIAYITSVFQDPFINSTVKYALSADTGLPITDYECYDYVDARTLSQQSSFLGTSQMRGYAACSGASWHIVCAGPDRVNAFGGGQSNYTAAVRAAGVDYDPTNGTVSVGDIVRFGGPAGPKYTLLPTIDRLQNIYNAVP
ncbi:MAG: prepilin-type N-terminal cleavage/methylation domain-containing protein [Candidatus Sumerlaeaceae bacterium]|nr:prepilin-type N-terminal cleavage/methylation domain-containing protein [Candidatus Sumerlaeaceae bacterium]